MSDSAVCWQCGASLAALSLPFSRFDACKQCRAELHVCRQCRFYDVTVAKHCREPIAEEVRDKERANVCDYFTVRNDAYRPVSQDALQARAQLDTLFGNAAATADTVAGKQAAADAARTKLDELFGKKP